MEFDLIKYRKSTLVKIIVTCVMIVIPLILAGIIIPYYINVFSQLEEQIAKINETVERVAQAAALVLVILIESILIVRLVHFCRVETSEDFAQKYYIKTHDERLHHITTKANAVAMKGSLYVLGVCTAIAGCFDAKVFLALLITFFGELIAFIGSYLYYKYKI
jgi:hypothetical protein